MPNRNDPPSDSSGWVLFFALSMIIGAGAYSLGLVLVVSVDAGMQPLLNGSIVVFVAGCVLLVWGIVLKISRQSPRGAMIVSNVKTRVSISSLYFFLGSLIHVLIVLFFIFPGFFFPDPNSVVFIGSILLCSMFGVFFILIGICTKELNNEDLREQQRALAYDNRGDTPAKLEFVRKAITERGNLMVDLKQVCKETKYTIDLVLREFYEMAGSGLIKGRLVHGHLFKIEGSIEEIVLQLDKMFETWSLIDKSAKIVG